MGCVEGALVHAVNQGFRIARGIGEGRRGKEGERSENDGKESRRHGAASVSCWGASRTSRRKNFTKAVARARLARHHDSIG
jgi:hypothetical protein